MKKLAIILLGCSTNCLIAQVEIANAPQWQLTFHVTEESGVPIPNANVYAGYYVQPPSGHGEAGSRKIGVTDTNGSVTLTAHTGPSVGYGANKAGYYSTSGLEYRWKEKADNKWQPWNPTIAITLKRIVKPIPMYAKWINTHVPELDKPVGYDLMVGDWVVPYGKGINTDVLFKGHFDKPTPDESDFELTVSFPNTGDGIQEYKVTKADQFSRLHSPPEAPVGGYQTKWVQTDDRKSGQPIKTNRDLNKNYFFRVRTVLDENGNVKSALYGKIYGDFMNFRYYLDPSPNDRNVEFDPKQNLMKNLKPGEGVDEP